MKRRQEAAEESERSRLQAEADAKAAAEAEANAARQAEFSGRDSNDAPGSPHSSREHEAGMYLFYQFYHETFLYQGLSLNYITKYSNYLIQLCFLSMTLQCLTNRL